MNLAPAIPHKITSWIVLADGGGARILAREQIARFAPPQPSADPAQLRTISAEEMEIVEALSPQVETLDYDPDYRGRSFDSAGNGRHAVEPHTDLKESLNRQFAQHIAQCLKEGQAQRRYDQLVLVAPPKMLGEIKAALDKQVAKLVVAELPKDFMKYDGKILSDHLRQAAP